EGGPAASAGLKNGDVVVAFGARPVTETRMLQRVVAAAPTDQESELTVLRAEGRRLVKVRLVSMPRAMVGERFAAEIGFVMRDPEGAGEPPSRGPIPPPSRRLAVGTPAIAAVLKGSAAEKAGLEVGDVILQVNDQPVLTRDAARDALADVPVDGPLRLTLRRGESRVSQTLPSPCRIRVGRHLAARPDIGGEMAGSLEYRRPARARGRAAGRPAATSTIQSSAGIF